MKSLTPQLTLVAPTTPQSAGLAQTCASLTLKGLKAFGRAYMESAQYSIFWIGFPGAYIKQGRA